MERAASIIWIVQREDVEKMIGSIEMRIREEIRQTPSVTLICFTSSLFPRVH